MSETVTNLLNRRSVRLFEQKPIPPEKKELILQAIHRSPTGGNMMLFSVIEVENQATKDILAESCDDQPFISKSPWVLLFLADYQRWWDYFTYSGVYEKCKEQNIEMRKPEVGDLMLAISDALIAAQTAVVASDSMGLGSCYIGDIMEKYEVHKELFKLPRYVFPIAMLCIGKPVETELTKKITPRFPREYVIHQDVYRPLPREEVASFEAPLVKRYHPDGKFREGIDNYAQQVFFRKYNAAFSYELNRSVKEILKNWS